MVSHTTILPGHATKQVALVAEVNDPEAALADVFENIRVKDAAPPTSMLPFLVGEYGLGELSPYVPNLYGLISEGIRWQRVRGTPAAVYRAIGWLGYSGQIEEEPPRRLRWNRFQIELSRVRDADLPDLIRLEGVIDLSPPVRSEFFRGFRVYDVRAAETSYQKTSGCLLSSYSGVRVAPGGAKWSFGRRYEVDHTLSEAELTALGAWQAPVPPGFEDELWVDVDQLWVDADWPWALSATQLRLNEITQAVVDAGPVYVRFKTSGGAVIGHSLAQMSRVRSSSSGEFSFGGNEWAVTGSPTAVMVQALTGFGDGAGSVASSASLVFDPVRASGVKPGQLWVGPTGLSGGVEIAASPIAIQFGLTVRERVRFLLRI